MKRWDNYKNSHDPGRQGPYRITEENDPDVTALKVYFPGEGRGKKTKVGNPTAII